MYTSVGCQMLSLRDRTRNCGHHQWFKSLKNCAAKPQVTEKGAVPVLPRGTEQRREPGLGHGGSFVPVPIRDLWRAYYVFCLWQGLCLSWCCPATNKY